MFFKSASDWAKVTPALSRPIQNMLSFVRRSSFFFSSRRRHTSYWRDWSSDVCSSDVRQDLPGAGHRVISQVTGPSLGRGGAARDVISSTGHCSFLSYNVIRYKSLCRFMGPARSREVVGLVDSLDASLDLVPGDDFVDFSGLDPETERGEVDERRDDISLGRCGISGLLGCPKRDKEDGSRFAISEDVTTSVAWRLPKRRQPH